jgi:tetratricopeptide (TPR) repeat protein
LDEHDKKAVYAMAMMRRPDNELLKAMLGVTDLEPEMRSLKARHSFVLLEGKGIRLHDKLESFLQDYLRCGLAGQSPMVRELSDRAVAYLEPRLSEWTQEVTDTADYFESDRIASGLLDLVQFKFWQDVEVGWRYAVPLFVESWQYNRDWQKQLLGIIEAFQMRFDGDSKKRLRIFTKGIGYYFNSIYYIFDANSETALLNELETLTKRGWLDSERKSQYRAILTLQRGRFLYRLGKYSESLQIYLELEQKLSETALHLRKALATEYRNIGDQLSWIEDKIVFSTQAQIAYQHAVELNKEDSNAWYGLGNSLALQGGNESAIDAFKKATQLDPKFAPPYNSLGNVYLSQDKFYLAIQSYQKAIELDPQTASSPYNGLGNTYQAQGNYESAIKFYKKAIELDPQFALPYNGLGVVYQAQDNYEAAIIYYEKAITLDSTFPYARFNLGFISWLQDKHDDAISLWKEGLALALLHKKGKEG